ncbi:MAG: DNA glycosylase AlkZ-like family protein, partial [Chloroflexota bacterium]
MPGGTQLQITRQVQRRFVLGRQGLWPGRRWRGLEGTRQALHAIEALQLDQLNIVARSQDIALYGRVLDYRPQMLETVTYAERGFFDYGGALFLYPMRELPHWRHHMQAKVEREYWRGLAEKHAAAIAAVQDELRQRGPLGNRDFQGTQRVNSYRGRKDTALALYYLWITGRVMIDHRRRFERIYDFTENVAPEPYQQPAPLAETEAAFAHKALAFVGLARLHAWGVSVGDYLQRPLTRPEEQAWMQRLVEGGLAFPVRIEAEKELYYALAEDLPLLEMLARGEIPPAWAPLEHTTLEEAVFLAPLEIASARGRAKKLFDFDYVWEVYKPAGQRRWGYYTLPILYGDRLAARADVRLER